MPAVTLFLLADDPSITDVALSALPWSDDAVARMSQIANVQRRRQFMLGRCLLAQAAGELSGVALTVNNILERAQASPIIDRQPDLAVSLSHTGPWLGLALAQNTRLGLDLELGRPRNVLALARHAYAAADLAWVEQASATEQAERFYLLWTLREAGFKGGLREHVYGEPAALPLLDDACAASGVVEPNLYWAVVAAHPINVTIRPLVLQL
ncbi:4'-phosphopantetheinyl transferase superfamily protein [Silvimonas sp.]|uniref:4'-phosphopantetheinyl transferase family protein n=1 Tax=Silvimonas sp. TaxID=2650811 RepID=UPI0028518642|nr:4'-phosphopantetheinyl transferase superfamily protein [Silvimonas sp.]MDR3430031.1 4'-phosphopantetheinyl transferase superfamily protein [Silvimonas sp.]